MRPSTSLTHVATCLCAFASVTVAWPGWLPDVDALVVRADDKTGTAAATDTSASKTSAEPTATGDSSTTDSAEETKTDDSGDPISTDLNTAGRTKTGTATETGTRTGTQTGTATGTETGDSDDDQVTRTSFPANSPAGGVSMKTPETLFNPTPLFMIGDYVTLGWNYTSLLGTPTAIDVLITCTANHATWTLTSNMTFETEVSYVWDSADTNADVQNPLLTEMYTMVIKDSDSDVTDIPAPGYLGAYKNFFFGMYQRQDYVPYDEWTCPGGCSAASGVERHAIGFLVTMAMITVFSFTWFVSGLNLH